MYLDEIDEWDMMGTIPAQKVTEAHYKDLDGLRTHQSWMAEVEDDLAYEKRIEAHNEYWTLPDELIEVELEEAFWANLGKNARDRT